jgi:hypothetical protein
MGGQESGTQTPEDKGMFAEFGLEQAVEWAGERGVERFRVDRLWDNTVCLSERELRRM